MALQVGYMGTKKFLAPYVSELIASCRPGPVLDVFSGMGAVGESLANQRALWVNDIQQFSCEVGHVLFTSRGRNRLNPDLRQHLEAEFLDNRTQLLRRFGREIVAEATAIREGNLPALLSSDKEVLKQVSSSRVQAEIGRLAGQAADRPYRLFTLSYSARFFSLQQAIDIDSVRFAIDRLCANDKTPDRKRWLLVTLGVVMVRIASSTGHFAQYLTPKESNFRFVRAQRARSVLETFWAELEKVAPVGSSKWRAKNRVFCSDAVELLERMYLFGDAPAIVYADPPYTDDQYSRFYHLWETIVRYDYPASTGKGCYRPDRFQTPFAKLSKVENSIEQLAHFVSRMDAQLVLSYPANGLLARKKVRIVDVLKRQFKRCEVVLQLNHVHSTMGASKGAAKHKVQEMIFFAEN